MKQLLILIFLVSIVFGDKSDTETIEIKELKSLETKNSVQKWLDGNFGLKPHKVNFILPMSIRRKPYDSKIPGLNYDNMESQLQVSLKLKLASNYFGLDEKYYVAYTQRAFWQFYIDSSPFRETLYSPETFVEFPVKDSDSVLGLRSLTFGYTHESNGQPDTSGIKFEQAQNPLENFSKSLNFFYLKLRTQHDALITDFKVLVPFGDLSDNPDIMDYRGHTELKFSYFIDEHMLTLMGRGNINELKGAAEMTYSYPLVNDANLYVNIFTGYGESLVDYNNYITKYSIGFSFSR